MKNRILFFSFLPLEYGGGVAKYFIEIAQGLHKRHPSRQIAIVSLDNRLAQRILSIYSLYFFGKQDKKIGNKETSAGIRKKITGVRYTQVGTIKALEKELRKADVVYVNNNILELFLLDLIIGIRSLPPLIIGFHTPTYYSRSSSLQSKLHNVLYKSRLYCNILKKAARLHVVNRFDEQWYQKRLPESDVRLIYYPFDSVMVRQSVLRDVCHLPKRVKTKRLLWVGRLTEQKGVADLCELIAATHGASKTPPFELFIAGEGELKKDSIASITFLSRHISGLYSKRSNSVGYGSVRRISEYEWVGKLSLYGA